MRIIRRTLLCIAALALLCAPALAADAPKAKTKAKAKKPAKAKVEKADAFMGDYQGTFNVDDGKAPLVAQVITLGDGLYKANILLEFDKRAEPIAVLEGKLTGDEVVFADGSVKIAGATLRGTIKAGDGKFAIKKVTRLSPTMGAKPPKGAIVLLNGKSTKAWNSLDKKTKETGPCTWTLTDDGAMEIAVGKGWAQTKQSFGSIKLHMEFRTPLVPKGRGQGRGNSGVYFQARYECQILDSYGLEGLDNECGGIYKKSAPRVNMCAPPLQWQTYDIDFTAATYDTKGKKTADPTMSVIHNGVSIQKDVALTGATQSSSKAGDATVGPIVLQDHGWPVQFRNMWVVEVD